MFVIKLSGIQHTLCSEGTFKSLKAFFRVKENTIRSNSIRLSNIDLPLNDSPVDQSIRTFDMLLLVQSNHFDQSE